MLRHYYTLFKLVESFKSLIGSTVEECFSQEKNSVILKFSSENLSRYLIFNSSPIFGCIYLADELSKAHKNIANIFPEIIGEVLQSVRLDKIDRIIEFEFIYTKVYVTLFGGSRNNFIIADIRNRIINALNLKKQEKGRLFETEHKRIVEFDELSKEMDLYSAISKWGIHLGRHYTDEFIQRYNLNPQLKICNLGENEVKQIKQFLVAFREICINSKKYYILSNNNNEKLLSLIPLHNYPVIINEYDDINKAVHRRFIQIVSERSLNNIKNKILTDLKRKIKKLGNAIEESKNFDEILKTAEIYRFYADLLISHPENKKKFGQEIQITDWEGRSTRILLDDKLNLIDNAGRYYKKAKKLLNEVEFKRKRLPIIEEELKNLIEQISVIENCKNIRELRKYMKSQKIENKIEKPEQLIKFRKFELGSGYTLYVGKSAANNDELTMKFAKPNDYWFHARGFGGSHCVLKQDSKDTPPKDIIIKAAEIAAYYSKGRKAKYVPVAYTQKKYVRKPKGADVGTVIIDKEQVIMVQPRLPDLLN